MCTGTLTWLVKLKSSHHPIGGLEYSQRFPTSDPPWDKVDEQHSHVHTQKQKRALVATDSCTEPEGLS